MSDTVKKLSTCDSDKERGSEKKRGENKLASFILEILDSSNHILWTQYGPANASDIYNINTMQQKSVKSIVISVHGDLDVQVYALKNALVIARRTQGFATNVMAKGIPLHAMLVECLQSTWGLNCSSNCSINCFNQSCDKYSGICNEGCNGYVNPPLCTTECLQSTWGLNCSSNCSINCFNQSCDKYSGICNEGCNGYVNPPLCTTECLQSTWGLNCSSNCSINCFNQSCDKYSGICNEGCNGYVNPPLCTTECLQSTWGLNCSSNCSINCFNQSCDKYSGICNEGCNGYVNPPLCTTDV
ncbi:cell death abnormality protein 1-like [Biomphalaria glabrata]|uniref:Cell death abnormality protein 1-like n=1 Tax=Biomphalaria glabrata TaxID=6526 RepID=A0A9W3ABM7_BIOGL|nr:cell death abnormality protein 1-like [Biomphalaria glabrata]